MLKVIDITNTNRFTTSVVMDSKNPTKESAARACELIRNNRNLVMSLDGSMEYACDAFGWVSAWFEGSEVYTKSFDEFRDAFVAQF